MAAAQRLQLSPKPHGVGDGHVRRLKEPVASGTASCVGSCQSAIDCLAHDSSYRDTAFMRDRSYSLVTLLIEQDL